MCLGIELATTDIVAIARLRGPRLHRLDVSLSCLMHSVSYWEEEEEDTEDMGMSYSIPLIYHREEEKYNFYYQVSCGINFTFTYIFDNCQPRNKKQFQQTRTLHYLSLQSSC